VQNKEINSILFVCLGNICRSPLAQGIAQEYCKSRGLNIKIDSAGTGDYHIGEPPCLNSIKVASMNSIDISTQKARQVSKSDTDRFDLIIGLDGSNIDNLKHMGINNAIKLGDFGHNGEDVPDPFFFAGFSGFDKVYSMIDSCVKNLIETKIIKE
jgi:protein-tyrosine phosphatase